MAEACKILENTYRSVNIAMVNELKILFDRMGIDVWEVIEAAKTKPFGFQAFYPGPGLGGHCIPIDPFYLSWVARKYEMSTRFIELAGEINTSMPQYVVNRTVEALEQRRQAGARQPDRRAGRGLQEGRGRPAESPSFKLMELLQAGGAIISYNDPHIPVLPAMRHYNVPRLASETLTPEYLSSLDCVADRHRSLGVRLRLHRPLRAAGGRLAQRHEARHPEPPQDLESVTPCDGKRADGIDGMGGMKRDEEGGHFVGRAANENDRPAIRLRFRR